MVGHGGENDDQGQSLEMSILMLNFYGFDNRSYIANRPKKRTGQGVVSTGLHE